MKDHLSRRAAIKNLTLGAAGALMLTTNTGCEDTAAITVERDDMKGNINHSACRWCYSSIPLEELCEGAKEIGVKSIELTTPEEWKILEKYGLTSAVGTADFADIVNGFNNPKNHEHLTKQYLPLIDQAKDNGIPNVIVFSGNRNGLTDEQGWENCAVGLEKVVKHAEKQGVTIIMELLNSKVDHKDYQCDLTPWGAKLVDKLGSPNFKLLYDIYHMQIMEGNIMSTIRTYKDYIAHYHTGGVPGRNELNNTQELNYTAIMETILATGYKGFVGQEFIPTYNDKFAALRESVMVCDV